MAKKTMFECDICKVLTAVIYQVKVNIQKLILCGDEERNHKALPIEIDIQVCSPSCLDKVISAEFNKTNGTQRCGKIFAPTLVTATNEAP